MRRDEKRGPFEQRELLEKRAIEAVHRGRDRGDESFDFRAAEPIEVPPQSSQEI